MASHTPEGPTNTEVDSDILRRGLYAEPVDPPAEHQDTHATKDEINRLTRELHDKNAKEAKRRKRNSRIGAGAGLAALLGGGGLLISNSPDSNPSPVAEAPANPGEEGPDSENPAEPIVESPATSPTDIPTFEDNPTAESISPENFIDFPNQEIRDWFTLDESKIAALRQAGAHEFAMERGATSPQEFDPAPWIKAFEENPDGLYPMVTSDDLDASVRFPQLNANLTAYAAAIQANDWLQLPNDRNPHAVAVHRAFSETILADSLAEADLATATRVPTDNDIVIGLMAAVKQIPDDAVITRVNVDVVKAKQGPDSADNGTSAMIFFRHDDGSKDAIEWKVDDLPPAPWVVETSGILQGWDEYRNENQTAFLLFQ